ncbi:LppX_LprAFG lipoprotein [Aeromicrobium sp. CTD01-1L150]|uniref:LppX_LprAFG lipoprotein n=1 Tax=Aeromicrobium sp. CTD01-1L150 TaxID=3341830 RepID=UPI0035C131B0
MRTSLIGLALLALLLSGCTDSSDDAPSADPSELAERLSTARAAIDDAESLEVSLATDELPQGVTGLLSAKGRGNHDPAFEGEVTVAAGGTNLDADVISVDDDLYVKTGFSPTFMTFDPDTLGAPDPASLLRTDDGVSQILQETDDLAEDGQSRDGEEVLTTITGTLPGSVIASVLPTADETGTFQVRYRLTDDDELRDASISGPFYPDVADVTYRLSLTASDQPVEIEAPARVGGS